MSVQAPSRPPRAPVAAVGEPIRLLSFLDVFAPAGTEGQVVTLARALDPARFALRFGCFERAGSLVPVVEALRMPITEYRIRRLYGLHTARAQWRLAREIRAQRIDIVHTYNFYGNVFAIPAARLAGAPVVVASMRCMADQCTPRQRWVQRQVCRLADAVVTNAEAIRRELVADGYDERRVRVIRNGLDTQRFVRAPEGVARVRHDLGIPPGAPMIVVLGRVVPGKGIPEFLEAAGRVAARTPAARFVIVGGFPRVRDARGVVTDYAETLRLLAARLGVGDRVTFTGVRADVPDVLAAATMSVLPSHSEGLSNAILESMAAGLPVVAADVGGNAEAVEDGVTGLLVPPRDPAALAAAMERMLETPALTARLGRAARHRVIERFGLERLVRETDALYTTLLERAHRRRPMASARRLAAVGTTATHSPRQNRS